MAFFDSLKLLNNPLKDIYDVIFKDSLHTYIKDHHKNSHLPFVKGKGAIFAVRSIDSIVVSPSQPTQENEMVFAVSAQWDVYVGVEKVSEQRKLFEVFVVEENGQWKVHDMMMY